MRRREGCGCGTCANLLCVCTSIFAITNITSLLLCYYHYCYYMFIYVIIIVYASVLVYFLCYGYFAFYVYLRRLRELAVREPGLVLSFGAILGGHNLCMYVYNNTYKTYIYIYICMYIYIYIYICI